MEIFSQEIQEDKDILAVRDRARVICEELGFPVTNQLQVTTSVFELGKNILEHGKGGRITFSLVTKDEKISLEIEGEDNGPGLTEKQIQDLLSGSASSAANRGIPAMKRLMDDIQIESEPGHGTTIQLVKTRKASPKSITQNIVNFFQQKISGRESPTLSQELRIQNINLVQTLSLYEEKNEELAKTNKELLELKQQLEDSNNELRDRSAELQEALLSLGDRTTELEAQNRRFSAVLQQMKEGVVITDRSGEVVNANQVFCTRVSIGESELIGKNKSQWLSFLESHLDMPKEEWVQFKKNMEQSPLEHFSLKLKKEQNGVAPLECRISPILDNERKYLGRLWFFE